MHLIFLSIIYLFFIGKCSQENKLNLQSRSVTFKGFHGNNRDITKFRLPNKDIQEETITLHNNMF